MLKIQNLTKTYYSKHNQIKVIDNFDLDIKMGDFVALIAPNGSGKTTLLNIIAGLETADSGTVEYLGKPIHRNDIGYIFQNYQSSLLPWKKIIDNIALPLQFRGAWQSPLKLVKAVKYYFSWESLSAQ